MNNYDNNDIKSISKYDWDECYEFIENFASNCTNESEKKYIFNKAKNIIDEISYHLENSAYDAFYYKFFSFQAGFKHLIYPETVDLEKNTNHTSYNVPTSMRDVDTESFADIYFKKYKSEDI